MVVNAQQSEFVTYPRYVCLSPLRSWQWDCGLAAAAPWAACVVPELPPASSPPGTASTDSWCDPAGTGLPRTLWWGLVLPLSTRVLVKLPSVPGCCALSSCRLSSSRGHGHCLGPLH